MTKQTKTTIHDLDTAPDAAKPALRQLQASLGMIPNLAGAMAESPALIHAFVTLRHQLETDGSFTTIERELLSLVNAAENDCRYCTAIHATFATKAGLPPGTVERLRSGGSADDPRLAALATFGRRVLRSRGDVAGDDLDAFLAAGFTMAQAFEVIARLALSVMANYASHLANVPPDAPIRPMYRTA